MNERMDDQRGDAVYAKSQADLAALQAGEHDKDFLRELQELDKYASAMLLQEGMSTARGGALTAFYMEQAQGWAVNFKDLLTQAGVTGTVSGKEYTAYLLAQFTIVFAAGFQDGYAYALKHGDMVAGGLDDRN
jgi:hypothetical protein